MKSFSSVRFFLFTSAVIVASVMVLGSRWLQTQALRTELELARMEASELERLRAANQRLRVLQVSAEELARLRADHAALPRLRAEIEALSKGLAETGKP